MDNGCTDHSDPIEHFFEWSPVSRATRYNLYVIGPNATCPLFNTNLAETTYRPPADNSYVANRNRLGWRWRVRAQVDGVWLEYSPDATFDFEPVNTDCPGL